LLGKAWARYIRLMRFRIIHVFPVEWKQYGVS
jgi:hypothetical protein